MSINKSNAILSRLRGARIQHKKKQRQQDHLIKTIFKNIVLVQDLLNVIWSRYEHAQTGSCDGHTAPRDFHPLQFAMQANKWAKEYVDGKYSFDNAKSENVSFANCSLI